jgi:dTDP-4-amino-4,6-dideoxygalactose transaminase
MLLKRDGEMIPLYKPYMPTELNELNEILHSGNLSFGKYGREFEQRLCSFIGTERLTLVNSYNSAVLVAIAALGIRSGDEVIASPMACLASNLPHVTTGIKVVWADVDPVTGTLNPDSVRQKISHKTKAIFHNHFCGYVGYIDEINAIGKYYGIPIVDDAIEAFGSEYKGNKIGNTGTDITIYSFQAVRLPTTVDGGAVVFKDQLLYEKSLLVRDSGIDRRYFRDGLGEISSGHDITVSGFGATMSEVNSYIGLQQLDDVGSLIERQRNNAGVWDEFIGSFHGCTPIKHRKWDSPNYWVYGILADNKIDTLNQFRGLGYYASGVHYPNNNYSVFGDRETLSGVDEFYARFLAIPCGWWFELNKSELCLI